MACAETLRTQAFLDGQIEGEAALKAERHLEDCSECQAFAAAAADLSDAIGGLPRHVASAELRARVLADLDVEDGERAKRAASMRGGRGRAFWKGVFGGAAISGLAAGLVLFIAQPPAPSSLVDQVTDAHTRALMNETAIEVVSSDHHTVKPWFAGKIAISPPVQDFKDQGYSLAGGRLDKVAGRPAAVLVYDHGKHHIDLFVWADRGGALPGPSVRYGYRSIYWKAGDLDYAAVSDTGAPELATFVKLVQGERE